MDTQAEPVKTLLENEQIRQKVSCFIQQEVLLPECTDKPEATLKKTNKIEENKILLKTQQNLDNFKKLSEKLKKKEQIESARKSPYSNVCGFKVNIKKLLENPDIRKQVAPFIEKQVLIPVWSNESDLEEIVKNDITKSCGTESLSVANASRNKELSKSQESTSSVSHNPVQNVGDEELNGQTKMVEQESVIKEEINIVDSTDIILDDDIDMISNKGNNLPVADTIEKDSNDSSNNLNVQNVNKHSSMIETNCIEDYHIHDQQQVIQNTAKIILENPYLHKPLDKFNLLRSIHKRIRKRKREKVLLKVVRKYVKNTDLESMGIQKNNSPNIQIIRSNSILKNPRTIPVLIIPGNRIQASQQQNIRYILKNTHKEHIPAVSDIEICNDHQSTIIKEETILPDESSIDITNNPNETEMKIPNETETDKNNDEITLSDDYSTNSHDDPATHNETTSIAENEKINNVNSDENQQSRNYQNPTRQQVHYVKKPSGRRRRRCFKCLKCGKKYLRYKMLWKHESQCDGGNQDYKCVMCSYITKDKQIFMCHVENHIVGQNFNEVEFSKEDNNSIGDELRSENSIVDEPRSENLIIDESRNENSIVDEAKSNNSIVDEPKREDFSLKQYLKVFCSCCNWSKDYGSKDENDFQIKSEPIDEDAENVGYKCGKCFADIIYQCTMCGAKRDSNAFTELRDHVLLNLSSPVEGSCKNCGKTDYSSVCALREHEKHCIEQSNLRASTNKELYVHLVRLELAFPNFTSGSSVTIKSEPSENLEESFDFENVSMDNDSNDNITIDEPEVKLEKLSEEESPSDDNLHQRKKRKLRKPNKLIQNETNVESKRKRQKRNRTNAETTEFTSKLDRNSLRKKKRNIQTLEWVQWFCQKCNKVEINVDIMEVGRGRKVCKSCKSKLRYQCAICDGLFDTFFTISYHLRYCSTQSKPQHFRRHRSKVQRNEVQRDEVQTSKVYKKKLRGYYTCLNCIKQFEEKPPYLKHVSRCGKKRKSRGHKRWSNTPRKKLTPVIIYKKISEKEREFLLNQVSGKEQNTSPLDSLDEVLDEVAFGMPYKQRIEISNEKGIGHEMDEDASINEINNTLTDTVGLPLTSASSQTEFTKPVLTKPTCDNIHEKEIVHNVEKMILTEMVSPTPDINQKELTMPMLTKPMCQTINEKEIVHNVEKNVSVGEIDRVIAEIVGVPTTPEINQKDFTKPVLKVPMSENYNNKKIIHNVEKKVSVGEIDKALAEIVGVPTTPEINQKQLTKTVLKVPMSENINQEKIIHNVEKKVSVGEIDKALAEIVGIPLIPESNQKELTESGFKNISEKKIVHKAEKKVPVHEIDKAISEIVGVPPTPESNSKKSPKTAIKKSTFQVTNEKRIVHKADKKVSTNELDKALAAVLEIPICPESNQKETSELVPRNSTSKNIDGRKLLHKKRAEKKASANEIDKALAEILELPL